MIGRQVLITNKGFEKDELFEYLKSKWNEEEYVLPTFGKPTAASLDEYIILPASSRYLVIIYPKKAGGLFNKKNKIVLTVCDSPQGAIDKIAASAPSRSVIGDVIKLGATLSQEQERKGPAEESLLKYTEYVKGILNADGLLLE